MNTTHDELNDVAARAKRRFPDHRVDVPFRVCLPVYELRLKVTEIAEDELSTPARFVLQLSNLKVTQPAEIGRMLGMSQNYVAGAAAELLGENLVTQSPGAGIGITDPGRQVLRDRGRTRRPRNKHIRVPYDPLSRRILDTDVQRLLDRDEVRKDGLFIPSTKPRRPRLGNVRIDQVRDYERFYGRQRDRVEILEISDIKDVRLKYRNDVILVKLDAVNSDKSLFAAFQAQQYLEEESAYLQRLADSGIDLVPDDLKADQFTDWIRPQAFSQEESSLLQEIDDLDQEVTDADRAVAEARATQGTTQDEKERSDLEAQIKTLESEKLQLEQLLEERESKLTSITEGQIRLIKTEEHRQLLMTAIGNASAELTLVSAWIDPYAFDDEVCRLLAAAIGRGVHVRIAWGLGVRKRGAEASRNREKGNAVLSRLRDLIPRDLRDHLTTKIAETHEKFIVCDHNFCAWGSFNWLSYRGERDSGYRRETSSYSERLDDIGLWKARADELFG
ncbi:MAG: hypothetical protein OXR67_00435 [Chloroflexota bacterium]|nr:hypothetical protein [Chloroflexota bacterium]